MKGILRVKWRPISRRIFVRRLVSLSTGLGLFSLVPLPASKYYLPIRHEKISLSGHPYWLEVLSRGASYIPKKAKININGWSDDDLRGKAYYALRIAFEQNGHILSWISQSSEKEMGTIIDNNKFGQFLLEATKGKYLFSEGFTPITSQEDPFRARIFYDLSSLLIRFLISKVDETWFNGFKNFDIKLLQSATTYLKEGIRISTRAMNIFPRRFQNLLRSNIGTGYNHLGLAFNLLGDIEQAYRMYHMALEWNPDDNNVTRNLEAIHENAIYINQKPLWKDILPTSMNEEFSD